MAGFSNKKGLDFPPSMWDANASANVKIASFLANNEGVLWLNTDDIQEPNLAQLNLWNSRNGNNAIQDTESKKPEYKATGWSNKPAIYFDNVGEALVLPLDLSDTDKITVFSVVDIPSSIGNGFHVVLEHGRYYASTHGFSLFAVNTLGGWIYCAGGTGTGSAYKDTRWDGITYGPQVIAFTIDSSLSALSQTKGFFNSVNITPDNEGVGTGMVGNFSNDNLYIGARTDGSGGLERPLEGLVKEVLVLKSIASDEDIVLISQLLMEKAGI